MSDSEGVICGVCLGDNLEIPVKLPCKHIFCYTCIKPWLNVSTNKSCPLCQQVVNSDTGKLEVVNDLLDKMQDPLEKDCPVRWQYAGRNYGFWDYSPHANLDIETQYQTYQQALNERQYSDSSDSEDKESEESEDSSESNESEESKDSEESNESEDSELNPPLPKTPKQLEKEKIKDLKVCKIEVGPSIYHINFEDMFQYPHNIPGKKRAVKRVDKTLLDTQSCKGTAGLEKLYV